MEPINRGVYRIHSRNLSCGVYSAKREGFIGIRDKFGNGMDIYLDCEILGHTASVIEWMGFFLPNEIELSESSLLMDFLKVPNALAAHKTQEEYYNQYVSEYPHTEHDATNWNTKRMFDYHK